MEGMTDKQFQEYKKTLIKLVIEILKTSKSLEEAIRRVKKLLDE